jgi:hypothetical protein
MKQVNADMESFCYAFCLAGHRSYHHLGLHKLPRYIQFGLYG